jgi:hypothetical protein
MVGGGYIGTVLFIMLGIALYHGQGYTVVKGLHIACKDISSSNTNDNASFDRM